MLRNHAKIEVPAFVVSHDLGVHLLESERRDVLCQRVLRKDLCRYLDRVILIFDQPNYHALQNHVRLP